MKIRNGAVIAAAGALAAFGGLAVNAVDLAPEAHACSSGAGGFTGWGGGSYCDDQQYGDGSYDHCVSVSVLGFGGQQCGRVCPPPPGSSIPAPPPPAGGRC